MNQVMHNARASAKTIKEKILMGWCKKANAFEKEEVLFVAEGGEVGKVEADSSLEKTPQI